MRAQLTNTFAYLGVSNISNPARFKLGINLYFYRFIALRLQSLVAMFTIPKIQDIYTTKNIYINKAKKRNKKTAPLPILCIKLCILTLKVY